VVDRSDRDDREFALWLASEVGVATVPGSSFHATPGMGKRYVRFAFCKRTATIEAAAERLLRIPAMI
jgi:aminotransferase